MTVLILSVKVMVLANAFRAAFHSGQNLNIGTKRPELYQLHDLKQNILKVQITAQPSWLSG